MEFYHLDFILHIKCWIFGFDSRRKFSTGAAVTASLQGESLSDASGGIAAGAGEYLYKGLSM